MKKFLELFFSLLLAGTAFSQETIKVGIVGDADNPQVSWTTEVGFNYQVDVSPDLIVWTDTGIVQAGTGSIVAYGFSTPTEPKLFYRISARKGAMRDGFDGFTLDHNDDDYTDRVPIGFPINQFGTTWEDCYINNNGNVTFEWPESSYTPFPLRNLGFPIIAPFWADVDTRSNHSDPVTYGSGTVGGRDAFGVNWRNVGYFSYRSDKLNSFQLIFIDRSDISTGDFDIEFNYNQVLWETGSHSSSGGVNGYGGFPAREGLSNGTTQTIELQYSGETIVQLDSDPVTDIPNLLTGLIYRSRNSTIPGRHLFQVRSGAVLGALNVNAGEDQYLDSEVGSTTLSGTASDPLGGAVSVQWSVLQGPAGISFSDPTILNPTVTFPAGEYGIVLQITATSVNDPSITASDSMTINP
ncbi:MAG: hypothetical protein EOP09_05920 [Proteobacteria bacterium]|nr:MAG: hypothetical protein EOP09_05920 [Pseudomonadota bacterium]